MFEDCAVRRCPGGSEMALSLVGALMHLSGLAVPAWGHWGSPTWIAPEPPSAGSILQQTEKELLGFEAMCQLVL